MKTPKDRFSTLNRKECYLECFYPGAMQDERKYVKYQHDIVCKYKKYKLHEKLKKHVLV